VVLFENEEELEEGTGAADEFEDMLATATTGAIDDMHYAF
jgi:hypothetical protein